MTKPMIFLLAVALPFALSACSTKSAEPTVKARVELPVLPTNLVVCDGPAPIDFGRVQNGYMPPKAMLDGWATDRTRLANCMKKHATVTTFYEDLRTRLHPEK